MTRDGVAHRHVADTHGGQELPSEVLQQAAATFRLLASAMRLNIVWVLAHGETDVGTLAELTGGTVQAVSQHLAKLKAAGLVRSRREGRHQVYVVDHPQLTELVRQMVHGLRGGQFRAGASASRGVPGPPGRAPAG
jgi:DNA-binding transcriptional ArsR family regulator